MSLYLMKITPHEPYFFGNEKNYGFPGAEASSMSNRYYIVGEKVPAQTTLIGVLRYILLPHKKVDFSYTDQEKKENAEAVGDKSFQYGNANEFGKIKNMSPVFLMKHDEKLIVTPYDHKIKTSVDGNGSRTVAKKYTPFSDYRSCGELSKKKYPVDFNGKDGIAKCYMSLGGDIYWDSDIFVTCPRVGINREKSDYFKKDYIELKPDFSFGTYVELDDTLSPSEKNSIVYMGQGKSLFTVSFEKQADGAREKFYSDIASVLRRDVVYCLSDMFLRNDVYAHTVFAITDTRDYRSYTTADGRVTKGSRLYKLISAGSIFMPEDQTKFEELLADETVSVIGYNKYIKGEK